jgi:hypothetical protein
LLIASVAAGVEFNRLEIAMPAVKTVKIIGALLIGFFLSVQHSASAQTAKEASQLNSRAIELFNGGRYSEAEPIFKRVIGTTMPMTTSMGSPLWSSRSSPAGRQGWSWVR